MSSQHVTRAHLKELVDAFYLDVRSDPLLAPAFNGVIGEHWDVHLPRMVEFWITVLLGTKSFRGNVLAKHMALDAMTETQFMRWLTLWHKNTSALLPAAEAQELQIRAHGIARNLFYARHGQFPKFVVQDGVVVDCLRFDRLPAIEEPAAP
jgi:hemoglobin